LENSTATSVNRTQALFISVNFILLKKGSVNDWSITDHHHPITTYHCPSIIITTLSRPHHYQKCASCQITAHLPKI
jgi:hypothetical protein